MRNMKVRECVFLFLLLAALIAWFEYADAGPRDPYIMRVCPHGEEEQVIISDGNRKMAGKQSELWHQPGALGLWEDIQRLEYKVYTDTRCTSTEALRVPKRVWF